MSRIIELSPDDIRFMQNSISCTFSNGKNIKNVVENIEEGFMDVDDIPMIRVVKKRGLYYAFDNRRLYLYRVLLYRGFLNTVLVKLAPRSKFQPRKLTTKNNGESIFVRGDETLFHSRDSSYYR